MTSCLRSHHVRISTDDVIAGVRTLAPGTIVRCIDCEFQVLVTFGEGKSKRSRGGLELTKLAEAILNAVGGRL